MTGRPTALSPRWPQVGAPGDGRLWPPPAGQEVRRDLLASYRSRGRSYLLDRLVEIGPLVLVHGVAVTTLGPDPYGSSRPAATLVGVSTVLAGAWSAVWFIANRVVRQGRTGRSLGRRVAGTRLVGVTTGRPVGPWVCLAREVLHVVDAGALLLGLLWPLWDAKRQTFADKICRTVVLRVP